MQIIVFYYIRLIYFLSQKFKIKLFGLGRVQRFLTEDFVFTAFNRKIYYKSSIEGSYDLLLIGRSNEPETHLFFNKLFPKLRDITFIDVGGSIGEFINLASTHPSVKKIYGFELRPDCALVLKKNAELNNENRIEVFEMALSDQVGTLSFNLNAGGSSSSIHNDIRKNKGNILTIKTELLDNVISEIIGDLVILIDVEGAEIDVLKGARTMIATFKPLIIFEYNDISKKFFHIDQIQEILGQDYTLKRVKQNGELDDDFENSWNCIAIPGNSVFSSFLSTN